MRTGGGFRSREQVGSPGCARSVYRFISVWQQESGKGPRLANGAAKLRTDLTSHPPPPWRALLGRPDPLGSRLLTNPSAGESGVGGERVV